MSDELQKTLLCVDDERDVLDALYDTLMDNYDVKTATSGQEALEIFEQNDIALVISDQRMPEMEGTQFLTLVHEKKPICKKILLTGYADIHAAIDAINLGHVDKYLSKPWDDGELLEAVGELLNTYKMDAFLQKMLEDGIRLKKGAVEGKRTFDLFETFLNSWESGICVLGEADAVEFINKKGLQIARYWDLGDVKGKDFKDIFLIEDALKDKFREKISQKDFSPLTLGIKRGDGSSAQVSARLTFRPDGSGQVCGMFFDPE